MRNTKLGTRLSITMGILLLSACAQMPPHRTVFEACIQDVSSISRDCGDSTNYSIVDGQKSAEIVIFEFDDQGYMATNRSTYQKNLARLRKIHKESGALMVLFAHGWKHDSDKDDSNLMEFEKSLLEIKEEDASICKGQKCAGRETIGVYLGWRGLSATVTPFKQLSFWNRKARAHLVGQDGAAGLLAELDVIQDRNKPEIGDINRFLMIGHSFGGALIYAAVQQRLAHDLVRPNKRGSVSRNVADLIILVNPAFEAARFEDIHTRADAHKFPNGHMPVLAIFTSESDFATKRFFPLGRGLSTVFSKYRSNRPDQAVADKTALGHYEPFFTHRVEPLKSDKQLEPSLVRLLSKACEWERFQDGELNNWNTDGVQLNRLPAMQKEGQIANPYMVAHVDEKVIPNHNDIWGASFRDFIYSMMAAQNLRGRACQLLKDRSRSKDGRSD